MKIFVFSTVFSPSVGGIETLVELLCWEFTDMGHEVRLATPTPGGQDFPFDVIRCPSRAQMAKLLAWCDVHLQANIALKYAWPRLLYPRRTIYQHNNAYERDDGSRSRLDRLKAAFARHSKGIAVSGYVARRTGVKHVVLNAYDDRVFKADTAWDQRDRDLVFLGRLVSQKGCETLVRALGLLRQAGLAPTLTIVGDGPERAELDRLAGESGVEEQVTFAGVMRGASLAKVLNRHRIMVVPSAYEEAFGIVAIEGLASGCIPVVSRRGGLPEAIAGHGFTFPSGDEQALADTLTAILRDPDAARQRLVGAESHLSRLTPRAVAERYISILEQERSH